MFWFRAWNCFFDIEKCSILFKLELYTCLIGLFHCDKIARNQNSRPRLFFWVTKKWFYGRVSYLRTRSLSQSCPPKEVRCSSHFFHSRCSMKIWNKIFRLKDLKSSFQKFPLKDSRFRSQIFILKDLRSLSPISTQGFEIQISTCHT